MKEKCSVCITPTHTEKFDRIYAAILDELKKGTSVASKTRMNWQKRSPYWSPTHWRSISIINTRSARFVAG